MSAQVPFHLSDWATEPVTIPAKVLVQAYGALAAVAHHLNMKPLRADDVRLGKLAQDAFDAITEVTTTPVRRVTTPHNDPIVQACIDHGGHFWPPDAPEDEPPTCTRCWFNPGWKAGKVAAATDIRPVTDDPQS